MTTDYTNRLIDIEVLQSITKLVGSTSVDFSAVMQQTKVVTGLQKALQRYTVMLLTLNNDVKFDDNVGSPFIYALRTGRISSVGHLYHVFNVASNNAIRQLNIDDNNEDFGTLPDDERIVSAVLLDANIDYAVGAVALTVQVTTAAGEDYNYVLPLSTTGD